MYIYDISLNTLWYEKYFRQTDVEKIKVHILCSKTFFRKSCRLWHHV